MAGDASESPRPSPGSGALFDQVYSQLRRVAEVRLRDERPGHTLQATALVHEVWLKIAGERPVEWGGPAQFYVAAAEAMRRILIDHARAKLAQKRGGEAQGDREAKPRGRRIPLNELREVANLAMTDDPEEILSLDSAVSRLESEDPQSAAVVRFRFYAGLSVEQTAEMMGISPATVKREWQFARAWLFRQLQTP